MFFMRIYVLDKLLYNYLITTMSIINPADYEVRAAIWFLNAKNIRPAEIHRQLVEIYGKVVMNEGNVRNCYLFLAFMMRNCVITDEMKAAVYALSRPSSDYYFFYKLEEIFIWKPDDDIKDTING